VTNSQKDNVQRILQNLDLQEIFESIITEANKPLDTKKHFLDLLQKFNIRPERGLSIGDNYINDIAPAINIGMQTVYIDLYKAEYPEYNGIVKSISELIKDMSSL
jgi:FMN phosphatase YigB (HAD superfamily)